jgi:outer membrane PBP1 activator LpoA protein
MRNRSIILCLIILTMNGCQSTQESAQVQNKNPRDRGELGSLTNNQNQYARDQYPAATPLLTKSAAMIEAGQSQVALDMLEQAQIDKLLPRPLSDQFVGLIRERNGNAEAQAIAAMNLLAQLTLQDMQFMQQFCDRQKYYACSAQNLIKIQEQTGSTTQATQNAIWSALMLANAPSQQLDSRLARGWWSLREQIFTSGSVDRAKQLLAQWRTRNPNHSAANKLPSVLANLQRYEAPKVVLLLPLSGRLSNAGNAIRDGFLGGYFADSPTLPKVTDATNNATDLEEYPAVDQPVAPVRSLTIYDSAGASMSELVSQVKVDGADLIIGPLRKDRVKTVASQAAAANISALLLNYMEPDTLPIEQALETGKIFQLGTAIEHEVTTLARALMDSEHKRLLVVHSGQSWSQRALVEFQSKWPFPLSVARFDEVKEVTGAVGGSMGVADSVARKNEIAQLLDQDIQFLPRARRDLDAVIALTSNVESRALVPALRFHFADNLPVYAISQSIRGSADIKDLAGFTVTELPILAKSNANMNNLVSTFTLRESPLVELYALGYDAYQLGTWIHLLQQEPRLLSDQSLRLSMATGIVTLGANGRFQRTLELANVDRRGKLKIANR